MFGGEADVMANYELDRLKILIADDHLPMRKIVSGILWELGVRDVAEAANGNEALGTLEDFKADILIVDRAMRPMDGIELTGAIRSGEGGVDPFIPIIMISAYTEKRHILQARDAGITEFLAKPISAKRIYFRLRTMIECPRSFVRTASFFGPDRRRRLIGFDGRDRRRRPYSYTAYQRMEERDPALGA